MKRRGVLGIALFGLLALAACTPATLPGPATDPNPPSLSVRAEPNYHVLTFTPGTEAATVAAPNTLKVFGYGLEVNDPNCKAVQTWLECEIGTVPAGRRYELPLRGKLVAVTGHYTRPNRPPEARYPLVWP